MQKLFIAFLLNLATACVAFSQTKIDILRPHINTWATTKGIITEPVIEVTPNGLYAQIDMTFKINAQSTYSTSDTMEAILYFDLPEHSFIHDSWLWLDETNIIKAAIIDKGRAIQIYEGIVKRRRDPSLLIKTGPTSYKLNVYPLKTTYPRKVKISYSVPFNWQNNKVNCELPLHIFDASFVKPDITLKFKKDATFSNPVFTETHDINNYTTSNSAFETVVTIPNLLYSTHNTDFNLAYNIPANNGVFVTTYQNTANTGTYQLAVNSTALMGNNGRRIVFVLDAPATNAIVAFSQVKYQLKRFIINHLGNNDYFNIFYTDGNSVIQASSNWIPADSSNAMNYINGLPAAISSDAGQYEQLLKTSLAYCQTQPHNIANTIIISNGNHLKNQAIVDTMFKNIDTHLGGIKNKIHIINNCSAVNYLVGTSFTGNELLFNKLSLASSGSYFENSYIYGMSNNIDVKTQLKYIIPNLGYSTTAYSIGLPVSGGFTHSAYDISGTKRFNTTAYYLEVGKYVGTINNANMNIQILTSSGVQAYQPAISQYIATEQASKSWINKHILNLEGNNANNINTTEIIDSSINNRVLCNYTAFLALETGDTINESKNENTATAIPQTITENEVTVKAYPNPFSGSISIECTSGIDEVEVYDIMGKKIHYRKLDNHTRIYTWNGTNQNNTELPSGIYIVKIRSDEKISILRVVKQ